MTESTEGRIEFLEAMRGNFFGDILLYALKILNVYHNEISSRDYGSGIPVVDPINDPESYERLKD